MYPTFPHTTNLKRKTLNISRKKKYEKNSLVEEQIIEYSWKHCAKMSTSFLIMSNSTYHHKCFQRSTFVKVRLLVKKCYSRLDQSCSVVLLFPHIKRFYLCTDKYCLSSSLFYKFSFPATFCSLSCSKSGVSISQFMKVLYYFGN